MIQQSPSPSVSTARETEYRLFTDVTAALNAADTATEAVEWNRRLWLALQTDLSSMENQMPDDLKVKMISLAVWVDQYTETVLRGEAAIDPLIEVNRAIMEGLAPQA